MPSKGVEKMKWASGQVTHAFVNQRHMSIWILDESGLLSYEGPPEADALRGVEKSGGVAALNRESSTRHSASADVWARASEGSLVGNGLSSPRVGAGWWLVSIRLGWLIKAVELLHSGPSNWLQGIEGVSGTRILGMSRRIKGSGVQLLGTCTCPLEVL
jgi:hypothetical protein